MRGNDDAFGAQLLAQLQGDASAHELIERDDGYIDVGALGRYFLPYRRWSPLERRAISMARGRVLDIGAGAGRHALHLQTRGLDVTAIDASVGAVQVCRARGVTRAEVLPIERVHALREAPFDTVLMLGGNFGLLASPRRAPAILAKLHRLTAASARLIVEAGNPYTTTVEHHLAYHRRNRARGRLPGQLRLRLRYQQKVGPWFDYLFASPSEMKGILSGTGWRVRTVLGAGRPGYFAIIEKR